MKLGETPPKPRTVHEGLDARRPHLESKTLHTARRKPVGEAEKKANAGLESLKKLGASGSFKALDAAGKRQAVALMRANLADPDARARVQATVDSLRNIKSAEGKTQVLEGLAKKPPLTAATAASTQGLLASRKFAGLSADDQKLVTEGLKGSKADPKYADNLRKLVEDPKFAALFSAERTAMLSQVKNYPDHRSVGNLQRMLQKDWFQFQTVEDKQRSLKTVAYLSQYGRGDRAIIDNTLGKMLDPRSDFKLEWQTYRGSRGNVAGEADTDTKTLYLSRNLLAADNGKVSSASLTQHMVLSTSTHEVNHIVNNDLVAESFKYFEAEYRAWAVGFKARYGREPSNQEAMEQRIGFQLSAASFYGKQAAEAMKVPAEAQKFYDFLGKITGRTVNGRNWRSVVLSDPSTWKTRPGDPAPRPAGNLDNH